MIPDRREELENAWAVVGSRLFSSQKGMGGRATRARCGGVDVGESACGA
jgi:hypothetical protein